MKPRAVSGIELRREERKWSIRIPAVALAFAVLGSALTWAGRVQAQNRDAAPTATCHVELAPMRDGVMLTTEVYLPSPDQGQLPVIMQRTPYNRSPPTVQGSNCDNALLMSYARKGFAVLNQDVRGRYRSQGVMNAMVQEANDGYDAIEWAAVQPWSNGKVGTFSGSYVGLTQWQPAIRTPPHLAAIAPSVTASDYHDHWTYVNSVFDLWFGQSWMMVTFASEQLMRNLEAAGVPAAQVQQQTADFIAQARSDILTNWVWQLPLTSFNVFRTGTPPLAPFYYDWLAHPNYDEFWAALDVELRYANVKVPALNFGAWYDIFQVGTVRNFQQMRFQAGTAEARQGTKLVMNCCGHAGTSGAIGWGPSRTDPNIMLRFFDHYLRGTNNGIEREPVVQMDILVPPDTGTEGTSFLLTANEFPLADTQLTRFDLGSGGHANTRLGDGVLVAVGQLDGGGKRSGTSGTDNFTYDPLNPVPTMGGNMCCDTTVLPAGAHEQSDIELRDDVLVYTSAPLDRNLAVIGPVTVKLWAKSSARDTDFTAKLVDVHLDGSSYNVLDRIVRARYRQGSKLPPSLIQPGRAYEYNIDLGVTGTIFRQGHRIRLEISSSNFPHYARNLNTGGSNEQDDQVEVAQQTVLHDQGHSSYLVLPVVPGVKIP
jgi:uncharacterized protein